MSLHSEHTSKHAMAKRKARKPKLQSGKGTDREQAWTRVHKQTGEKAWTRVHKQTGEQAWTRVLKQTGEQAWTRVQRQHSSGGRVWVGRRVAGWYGGTASGWMQAQVRQHMPIIIFSKSEYKIKLPLFYCCDGGGWIGTFYRPALTHRCSRTQSH